jgi:hypothetical protein
MRKKLLATLLCAGMMLILLPQAVQAAAVYTYIDENGDTQTATSVTPVAADTATLATGWYVVNSNVTCDATIIVSGDVNLILSDGFTLTVTGSSDNAGINVSAGNSLTIYGQAGGTGTVIAQGGANGAGIGGGKAQSGGSITINGGTVTATGGTGGAGIGGGTGLIGGNGGDGFYGSSGGTGGSGGTIGSVTISDGIITANGSNGGAGIGGGIGGTGGRGGSYTVGFGGGQGGVGGAGGTIIINGGMVKVSGSSYVKIDGGVGGAGGNGGFKYSGGSGGRGGTGGNGGKVIIHGGTVASTGSGTGIGIGGGMGGTGGNGGDGIAGAPYGSGSHGATGTASGISDSVINGGSVNAEIGCTPTTGGATPVNVYPTVVCFSDAQDKDVSALSISQSSSLVTYGINDMKTDANGKLYLYLPAYDDDTTAEVTAGGHIYSGYHGSLSSTATYSNPNVLKIDQSALTFTSTDVRTFTFGDAVVLDTAVTGGTLPGTAQYTYSGTDLSTGGMITDSPTLPANAGNYTIKATLPGYDLYYDAIATKDFTINPKSIAGFTVEDISEQTYTGEDITPPAIVKDGTKTLSGTDYTITYENNKNAGTATAAIAGKGNYTGNLARNFEILPKDISLSLSAAPDEAMVGGNVVLTASVLGAVDLPAGTVTFKYGDIVIAQDVSVNVDGSGYSAVSTWSNVPAGEYGLTASYAAAGSDNYSCVSNGLISDFNITKYDQPDFAFADGTDYSVSQGTISKTYGDSTFTLQTSGKLSAVAVSFAVTNGNDVVSVNAATGLVSILKSGTAVVTATSPTDAMYNEVSAAVTIQVAKADQSGFGFAEPTINKTYGDGPFVISASGGQSIGKVTYAVTDGGDVVSVNSANGRVELLKSGTAVITATKETDDYYNEAASQLSIHVEKADQAALSLGGIPDDIRYGDADFIIGVSGGSGTGALGFAVTSGDAVTVNAVGKVSVLRSGRAILTVTKAGDDRYNGVSVSAEIQVKKVLLSDNSSNGAEPTPLLTSMPLPTAIPSATPTGSITPSPTQMPGTNTGIISGTLLDSNGNPMAGYVVELHSDPMTTVTDANGRYAFYDVDYTSHELIVKTPEGDKIAEFELVFSEGEEFSTDVTEKGVDITYMRSTDTVNIEVKLIPDQSGAEISQVFSSDNLQTSDALGGIGSVLWWIGGGVLVVMLITLLTIILLKKKKSIGRN